MAEIDKRFYRGTDEYSDGDEAENTILQIVREGRDFYELDQMSWPTFYHLNPIRENICNWYPFEKGSRVLEIGAGCGGVTGALCGRGLQVYSVDLSLRRSTINYERHRSAEDLHLVVGNLNDIVFPEPFDYILLIGVLEYAGRFTEGEQPYRRFLENIRQWLKPDGKLLIAIENRTGLKYFAGASEDHLGIPFIGLKGYPEDRGIRTFSRYELKELLQKSGYQGCRFFYPYPDYKLPQEIFTDQILSCQHIGKPYQVFDLDRADLFQEEEMWETLRAEGAAGAFANSFLAEVSIDPKYLHSKQDYYVQVNSGRKKVFQTGTRIYGEGKPEYVLRYPLTEAANKHIAGILENERRLAGDKNVLRGEMKGTGIQYPYMPSQTLEDMILEAERHQNRDAVINCFQQIKSLAEIKPGREAYDSEKFTEWFGEARIPEKEPICTAIANISLMPDTVLVNQGQQMMIDCEWVTDFAVPVSFLTWRCVEKTYEKHPLLQKTVSKEELLGILEIPEENSIIYQEWSWHFENQYVSEKSLSGFARMRELTNFHPMMAKAKDIELAHQEARIGQLEQHEQALVKETALQKEQIAQLIQNNRNLEEQSEKLKETAQQLSRDLEDLLSSRSWRMTSVFRAMRHRISGTENKKKN